MGYLLNYQKKVQKEGLQTNKSMNRNKATFLTNKGSLGRSNKRSGENIEA